MAHAVPCSTMCSWISEEKERAMTLERIEHCIEPTFDERSRVLVLGTMPSPASREHGYNYGHPRNRFWQVMAALADEPIPQENERKRDFCLRHHIALWDVLASCDIEGASGQTDEEYLLGAASAQLHWAVGRLYAEKYLKQEDKDRISELVDEIKEAYTQVDYRNQLFDQICDSIVLSTLISDDTLDTQHQVCTSDRHARYDGVLVCEPNLLIVIENKPFVGNVWDEQLDLNFSGDGHVKELIRRPCCLSWRRLPHGQLLSSPSPRYRPVAHL